MGHKTALVVDDSKLARITLKKKLEQRQLNVVMVESGAAALEQLAQQSFDLVFMDHLMPDMDGFETTQAIKANEATAHIPVVMCSGKDEADFADQAGAIGASGVLSKPPENSALDKVLAQFSPNTDSVDSLLSGSSSAASAPKTEAQAPKAAVKEPVAAKPVAAPVDNEMSQALSDLSAQVATLGAQLESQQNLIASSEQSLQQQVLSLTQEQQAQTASLASQIEQQGSVAPQALEASLKEGITAQQHELNSGLKSELEAGFASRIEQDLAPLLGLSEQVEQLKQELAQQSNGELGSAEAMVGEIQQALQPVLADMLDQRMATETGQLKQQIEDQVGLQLSYRLEQLKAEQLDAEALKTELQQLLDERLSQSNQELRQSLTQELQPLEGGSQDVTSELKDLREESIQAVRQAAEQALHKLAPVETEAEQNLSGADIITELNQQLEQQKRDMETKTGGLKFALFCSTVLAIAGVAGHWLL